MNYFKSNQVKVFPCANRGKEKDPDTGAERVFNPEARFNTEENLTLPSYIGGNDTYIISQKNPTSGLADGEFEALIHGYYFKVTNLTSNEINTIFNSNLCFLGIKLSENTAGIKQLVSLESTNSENLDREINGNYYFTGLGYVNQSGVFNNNNCYIETSSVNCKNIIQKGNISPDSVKVIGNTGKIEIKREEGDPTGVTITPGEISASKIISSNAEITYSDIEESDIGTIKTGNIVAKNGRLDIKNNSTAGSSIVSLNANHLKVNNGKIEAKDLKGTTITDTNGRSINIGNLIDFYNGPKLKRIGFLINLRLDESSIYRIDGDDPINGNKVSVSSCFPSKASAYNNLSYYFSCDIVDYYPLNVDIIRSLSGDNHVVYSLKTPTNFRYSINNQELSSNRLSFLKKSDYFKQSILCKIHENSFYMMINGVRATKSSVDMAVNDLQVFAPNPDIYAETSFRKAHFVQLYFTANLREVSPHPDNLIPNMPCNYTAKFTLDASPTGYEIQMN